jgi:hypothetical protein
MYHEAEVSLDLVKACFVRVAGDLSILRRFVCPKSKIFDHRFFRNRDSEGTVSR